MQCIPSSLLKFSPIDKEDHWLSCSLEGWKKWIGLPIYHRVIDCSITFLALFLLKKHDVLFFRVESPSSYFHFQYWHWCLHEDQDISLLHN